MNSLNTSAGSAANSALSQQRENLLSLVATSAAGVALSKDAVADTAALLATLTQNSGQARTRPSPTQNPSPLLYTSAPWYSPEALLGKVPLAHGVRIGLHRTASDRIGLHRTASDRIGPHRTASDRIGPHRTASDRIGPHRTALDRIGPHRTASDRIGLHRPATGVPAMATTGVIT